MSDKSRPLYGQGVGTSFLDGVTTRDLRPKQLALLNHPLWTGLDRQQVTRQQLANFALQDSFLIREIHRLDGMAVAKAPSLAAADVLITKLQPKSGAEQLLRRFGQAVGLSDQDFDQAQPLAGCLALTAQLYYHLVRSSFIETVACIGASETIFLEICGRVEKSLKGYGFSDEALRFFSFHEYLESAERSTTELLRSLAHTQADREAVTRAAELCYDFEKLFYDTILNEG